MLQAGLQPHQSGEQMDEYMAPSLKSLSAVKARQDVLNKQNLHHDFSLYLETCSQYCLSPMQQIPL